MKRALIAIALFFLPVSLARADVPNPFALPWERTPPPSRPPFYGRGPRLDESKLIPVEHKIATEKEFPNYLFFTIVRKRKDSILTPVKLDPKTPVVIASLDRGDDECVTIFVAVPSETSKMYDNEDDFHAAIKDGRIKGMVRSGFSFDPLEKVTSDSPPKYIVKVYVLDKIDPREGITLSEKPEAAMKPDSPAKDTKGPGEGKSSSSFVPAGRVWVSGLVGSAALVLGGLWLVGRNRQS